VAKKVGLSRPICDEAPEGRTNLAQRFNAGYGDGWLSFAYIRLAMIEEAAARPDAEQDAVDQARALYNRDHHDGQGLTFDELKNAVLRLDRAADNL
jgi:hypothetical protein